MQDNMKKKNVINIKDNGSHMLFYALLSSELLHPYSLGLL